MFYLELQDSQAWVSHHFANASKESGEYCRIMNQHVKRPRISSSTMTLLQDLQLTDRWTRGKRSNSVKNVGLICSFMNWGFPEIPNILISNLCWQCNVQWIIYLFLRLDIFVLNQWCFLRRQNLFQSGFSLIGWMERRGIALGCFLETFVEMHVETSPFTWVFHRLM